MKRVSLLPLWSALTGLLLFTASWTMAPRASQPAHTGNKAPSFVGIRWQMISFTLVQSVDYDGDGKPNADLTRFMSPCDRDNTLTFEANGQLSDNSGKLHCDAAAPAPKKPGSWRYYQETNTLRLVDANNQLISEWAVLEASASVLKVSVRPTQSSSFMDAVITWKRA